MLDSPAGRTVYHRPSDRYLPARDLALAPSARLGARSPDDDGRRGGRRPRRHSTRLDRTALAASAGNPVAFGIYFSAQQMSLTREAALMYSICAPPQIFTDTGGLMSADWYYLTTSNRSRFGVEALIRYPAPDSPGAPPAAPEFDVFDWSLPNSSNRWVHGIAYPRLAPYLEPLTLGASPAVSLPALHVVNGTRMIGTDRWINEVYLHAPAEGAFHRVYTHEYVATVVEQQSDPTDFGFWGPILESGTSAQRHRTHHVGFAGATLTEDGVLEPLTPGITHVHKEDSSARVRILAPNSTWLVSLAPANP